MTTAKALVDAAAWEPVTLVGRHVHLEPFAPHHAAD